jgi:hypothetical protein
VKRIRSGAGRSRQQPLIGAPDPALTPNGGLAVITELCGRLGVIGALDTAVGPVKQRDRGLGAGEAMIATLRWRLIAVLGRLTRHARHLILRLPPGHDLLSEVLARLRELPAPA